MADAMFCQRKYVVLFLYYTYLNQKDSLQAWTEKVMMSKEYDATEGKWIRFNFIVMILFTMDVPRFIRNFHGDVQYTR